MEITQNPTFISFPEIGQLRDAVVMAKHLTPNNLPVLSYRGSVKMHGSNAALVFNKDGTYHCQSRNRVITIGDDNAGFASHWTSGQIEKFLDLDIEIDLHKEAFSCDDYDQAAFFGEWCGGKVSPNVALAQLPRMFVIFAIATVKDGVSTWGYTGFKDLVCPEIGLYNTDLFGNYEITINLAKPANCIEQLEAWTLAVENECPVGKYFGVSGTGEGIVFTCPEGNQEPLYNFKSAGFKHKIAAKMGSLEPGAMAELSQLVDLIMRAGRVESRVEQGVRVLREQGHPMESTRETKLLIDWIVGDIEKENLIDIADSGLDKKKVIGGCLSQAKHLYKQLLDRF